MLNGAHAAGWRAGIVRRPIIQHQDGTKTIEQPACPFTAWWQVLHGLAWYNGFYEARIESHARWITRRKRRTV